MSKHSAFDQIEDVLRESGADTFEILKFSGYYMVSLKRRMPGESGWFDHRLRVERKDLYDQRTGTPWPLTFVLREIIQDARES